MNRPECWKTPLFPKRGRFSKCSARSGSSWDSRLMNTVVHRRESCPGSCPRVCTRGRSAGITPRRYRGTGFVRSLDLDQFHVLHVFFLFLFLVRFARCRLPSSVRRSVEVTVVPFASGGESGRFHDVSARQELRRLTSDTVFHFIQVRAAARVSDPRCSTERHQMMSETTVTTR